MIKIGTYDIESKKGIWPIRASDKLVIDWSGRSPQRFFSYYQIAETEKDIINEAKKRLVESKLEDLITIKNHEIIVVGDSLRGYEYNECTYAFKIDLGCVDKNKKVRKSVCEHATYYIAKGQYPVPVIAEFTDCWEVA